MRGLKNFYAQLASISLDQCPEPADIYLIGLGKINGNQDAAIKAYNKLGEIIGDALANAVTLIDGLVVIGGGLSGACSLFLPEIIREMNGVIGSGVPRLEVKAFNLEEPDQRAIFLQGEQKEIKIPATDRTMQYDQLQRVGVGISKLGTSRAVGIGAYAFALQQIDAGSL